MGDEETKDRNKKRLVQTTRSRMHVLCRVTQIGPARFSTSGVKHSGGLDVGGDEGDGGVVLEGGKGGEESDSEQRTVPGAHIFSDY
jgi:hypothetical protein